MKDWKIDKSWMEIIKSFSKPTVIRMLFLGFSAGIPILLIFSSLSLWLREAGVSRSAVTFFSWAALGYSFKFVWAPLIDSLPLPVLSKIFGRRRSWMLVSQAGVIAAICGMAFTDPTSGGNAMTMMALFAVLLGFSSATQDIVIDAFRIESDEPDMQALLSSTYMAGYRIAMIVAGAGALWLAEGFGSTATAYSYTAWKMTYLVMAATMLVGVATVLMIPEPDVPVKKQEYKPGQYARFVFFFVLCVAGFIGVFSLSADMGKELKTLLSGYIGKSAGGFVVESTRMLSAIAVAAVFGYILAKSPLVDRKMVKGAYVDPLGDFFKRYGSSVALLILCLIGLYRISDIVLGVISNVFYQDMGYTKSQIAGVVKSFGVVMTIVGGFVGGVLTIRFGTMKMMMVGAIAAAVTNLLFLLLAKTGASMTMLYVVISADNLAAGLASAAFIAFLSGLVNVSFTATQYAVFSSLMTLFPKILGGYSGSIVDSIGYPGFFIFTTLLGVPVLFLVWMAGKKLEIEDPKKKEKPPQRTSDDSAMRTSQPTGKPILES